MTRRSFNDPHGKSDEARQGLLDNRTENAHPKRHRTRRRSKKLAAKKRAATKHKMAIKAAREKARLARVKRYWAGEGDHP